MPHTQKNLKQVTSRTKFKFFYQHLNQLTDFSFPSSRNSKENTNSISAMETRKDSSIPNAMNKSSSRITTQTKRSLLNPNATCIYVDPKTKHQCKAKVFLSMDHFTPQFAGGGHEPENLQVLCKNHNIYRYKKQAGIERKTWS